MLRQPPMSFEENFSLQQRTWGGVKNVNILWTWYLNSPYYTLNSCSFNSDTLIGKIMSGYITTSTIFDQ